ncbi:MAG: sugar phosphate isomerase/epimerase [Planctomycetota bacterium]|nr:sugar phosphate isomerase/epimerase [Planctomycetota bacterium]
MPTRTGNLPIGFRRGGGWQKDLKALARWAKDNGFDRIDLGRATKEDLGVLRAAGLDIGSADLVDMGKIMANDAGARKDAISQNVAYVKEAAAAGAKVFFTCIIPGDPAKKRSENYALAVECFGPIAKAIDGAGATLAIEGWPGGGPYLGNLCCNPETYRSIIKDLGCKAVGVNYDPSHLIRMGIDHVRFLHEFAPRVWHVHGKDTEIINEAVYEYGLSQGSVFAKGHGFGENVWRYTIPGHGCARWCEILKLLQNAGYKGAVSVELEDENFNGSEAGEKAGFLHSLAFLKGA